MVLEGYRQASSSESTKFCGSKTIKSSTPSPTPTYFTGMPEFAFDGDHDAAACGAVEFGQHDPGHRRRGEELAGLGERVLARRGVEHHEGLDDLARFAVRDPADFGELVEQVRAVRSPPGGVGEDDVRPARLGPTERVVHDRAGIGPFVGAHDVRRRCASPIARVGRRRRRERCRPPPRSPNDLR